MLTVRENEIKLNDVKQRNYEFVNKPENWLSLNLEEKEKRK